MEMIHIFLLFLILWGMFSAVHTIKYTTCSKQSEPWVPTWLPDRDDLLCSTYCDDYRTPINGHHFQFETLDSCCTCHSCTIWEGLEVNLYIEYASVTGKSFVVSDKPFDSTLFYEIRHKNGEMTEIPSNLCKWDRNPRINQKYASEMQAIQDFEDKIVKIDFSTNKIRELSDLNCMPRLDTVNLQHNRVTYLSNETISNLTFLRELDLSDNRLVRLDPLVLFRPTLSIYRADFSHNQLKEIDFTNAVSLYPFCHYDYTSNVLDTILNELDIKIDHSIKYGPGIVSLVDNLFETWPDFKEVFNLDSLTELSAFDNGFDFRGNQINCDCNVEPFMDLAEDIKDSFWNSYYNVTCYNPPELSDVPIVDIDPLKFVCPLTAESNCPKGCICIDHSKLNVLEIYCSNINLREMPQTLPDSKFTEFISLNLSNNRIKTIPNLTYLSKLIELDLSANIIEEINEDIPRVLEIANLDISNNYRIRKLPKRFQYRNLCSTLMHNVTIDCDCQARWIETWLNSRRCNASELQSVESFKCDVPGVGVMSAYKFRSEMLEDFCSPNTMIFTIILVTLSVITIILIICGLIIYLFRYELLVIWLRRRRKSAKIPKPQFKWDVAITFNEDDDGLRKWVKTKLVDKLLEKGYRVFLPCIDVPFGSERDKSIIETFPEICNFLLVLSESYLANHDYEVEDDIRERRWTENEWKYAWHQYKKDQNKNIVIINYAHISTSDVKHPQIRAYLRVGHTVEFGNHELNIMEKIMRKLGPPGLIKQTRKTVEVDLNEGIEMADINVKVAHETYDNELPKTDHPSKVFAGKIVTRQVNFYEKKGIFAWKI